MVATTTGERYDVKHRPEPTDDAWPICAFELPSGEICGRFVNWVALGDGLRENSDMGFWRHNPRPYANR